MTPDVGWPATTAPAARGRRGSVKPARTRGSTCDPRFKWKRGGHRGLTLSAHAPRVLLPPQPPGCPGWNALWHPRPCSQPPRHSAGLTWPSTAYFPLAQRAVAPNLRLSAVRGVPSAAVPPERLESHKRCGLVRWGGSPGHQLVAGPRSRPVLQPSPPRRRLRGHRPVASSPRPTSRSPPPPPALPPPPTAPTQPLRPLGRLDVAQPRHPPVKNGLV